ncbi:MAG: D-aspartate ligase [Thermoleophilaceae bacterium]|nr:D-aspartate ligase [Thermoleophilaceae bacterium]
MRRRDGERMTLDRSASAVLLWPSLAVMRSLGRLGVPVFCLDPDGTAPATASRYCREAFSWDLRAADPERSIEFLATIAQRVGGRPILMAVNDDPGAIFMAEHGRTLARWYRLQHPSAALATGLSNKEDMFHLCMCHGVPTPGALFPKSRADVEGAVGDIEFPIVLKGIDTELQARRSGTRMAIVHDRQELLARYDELEDPASPNLMLQEYIPGGADSIWMFNGYFDADSRCLLGFTGRKLRQCPVRTGATSLGVCARNEVVEQLVVAFMKALGYRGALDLGFRYDRRDGQYKLLDVNPRIGATFRLFVDDNDLDVARALHLDLTGRPVTPGTYREGRKWIDEYADLTSSYRYIREGDLRIRDWLRSFQGIEEGQLLARDDVAPVAQMAVNFARNGIRRVARPTATVKRLHG